MKNVDVERYDLNPSDFMKLDLESAERLIELAIVWAFRNDELRAAGAEDDETLLDTYASDWK